MNCRTAGGEYIGKQVGIIKIIYHLFYHCSGYRNQVLLQLDMLCNDDDKLEKEVSFRPQKNKSSLMHFISVPRMISISCSIYCITTDWSQSNTMNEWTIKNQAWLVVCMYSICICISLYLPSPISSLNHIFYFPVDQEMPVVCYSKTPLLLTKDGPLETLHSTTCFN